VIVKLGTNGTISLFNSSGTMDLLADVAGWFPEGQGLEPLVPSRILDTRVGNGAPKARIGPGATIDLKVAGRGGVPVTGAGAVVLNITAVRATARSFVTAWPTGAEMPVASNLNVQPGDTVPNLVIVKLGTNGTISLFNSSGTMDLLADVAGWFPEGDSSSTTMTLRPGTVLAGSGDVISFTGTSDTGATVVLAASADNPPVGGHLAVAPHPAVPQGLAGRVVSKTIGPAGTTVLVLAAADLQDMFSDMTVSGSFTEDLDTALEPGSATESFHELIAAPLGDDQSCSGSVGLGSLPTFSLGELTGTFDFDLSDRYARMVVGFTPSVSWELSAAASFGCTFTVFDDRPVGAIGPLIFDAGLDISISATGAVSSASIGGEVPIRIGFEYDRGTTTNLSSYDATATGSGTAANVSVTVGLGIKQKAKAFGIIGLAASAGPNITARFQNGGCFTLEWGVSAALDGEIGRWGVDWNVTLGAITLGPFTLLTTGCSGKMWTGTVDIETRRIYAPSATNRFETTESASYELAPTGDLDADGGGMYPAVISGTGSTDQFGFCPFSGTVRRAGNTTWSEPSLLRRNALELALDTDSETWLFRPPLIQGAITDASETATVVQTITSFCTETGTPSVETGQASTVLGWNDGVSTGQEPLLDVDSDPDRLVGSTTWDLSSNPATSMGAVAYEYIATYDLRLIDI
jgi:hypothetical protein